MVLDINPRIDYEYSIEEGFKAILVLETSPEYSDAVQSIKNVIVDNFKNIPEINGVKKYNKIVYYPNGLCSWRNTNHNIILDQWENNTELKKEKKQIEWSLLKKVNPIWYAQLMIYLKKPVRVKKTPVKYIFEIDEKISELSEDEEGILNKYNSLTDELKYSKNDMVNSFLTNFTSDILRDESVFPFLNEEELKALSYFFTSYEGENYYMSSYLYRFISDNCLQPGMDRFEIDLTPCLEKEKFGWSFCQSIIRDENKVKYIYDQIKCIDDENIQKVLSKFDII